MIKKDISVTEFIDGILSGDRVLLSRAITLVESSKAEHQAKAQQIIEGCLAHTGNSVRIGITGVPGVGKSTFIESFGIYAIEEKGKTLAVLAVDPSSSRTKGSILGDKTRMETLSNNEKAYIRPTAAAGSLGGVARRTRETISLCEAAGFDTILVETVGVGQSETSVHGMVDFFLLLMLAGAGDELQGIKRGIMEMADSIIINKADSGNEAATKRAVSEYKNALHLFPPTESGWIPKVSTCSALQNKGISDVWEIVESYMNHTKTKGYFQQKRNSQQLAWYKDLVDSSILEFVKSSKNLDVEISKMESDILENKLSVPNAVKKILSKIN